MMFRYEDNKPKVNLENSYIKNYEFLFEDIKLKEKQGIATFNDFHLFKYKKLILKYDTMPNEEEIRHNIKDFLDRVNVNDTFRVFNIKGNVVENDNRREYIVTIALINVNLN